LRNEKVMGLKEKIVEKLKTVMDPGINMNIYDMGLITGIDINDGNVSLTFRPSSPFCPMGIHIAKMIKEAVKSVEGIKKVNIEIINHIQAKQFTEMINKE